MQSMSTTTSRPPATPRYDGATIALHWVTVILVGLLWVGGQTFRWFGRPAAPTVHAVHVVLGLTLAVVLIARIAWRGTGGRSLKGAGHDLLDRVAHAGHLALYALMLLTVALGLTTAWVGGTPVFGLFTFPGHDRALAHTVHGWHALAANAIALVAAGHAAVALLHQYVLRDGTLDRMLPHR